MSRLALIDYGSGNLRSAEKALVRAAGGLAEDDADILHRVVKVDVKVTLGFDLEVERAVATEGVQHVIQETDTGGDAGLARPIQVDPDGDFRLAGLANHLARARHGLESFPVARARRETCGRGP